VDIIYSGHFISGTQEFTWYTDSSVNPGLYIIKFVMDDIVGTYTVIKW